MYEEFMVVERQSADLRSAIESLSDQIGAVAAYAQVCTRRSLEASIQALQTSTKAIETRMLGIASALETSADRRFEFLNRNLVNLSLAQSDPLRRPREIFAVGIKPLADGQVPSLPARPVQLPFEGSDAESAAAPAPAVIPGAEETEPVLPEPDGVAR
jgi:hypothetical protein